MEKQATDALCRKPILYLAPIRGYTHALFRNIYQAHFSGIDVAVAPFIVTMGNNPIRSRHLKDVLPENNSGAPLIPQILSNDPDGFIHMARVLADLGYETINWNLGCPFPMVAKKKRGSGLLPYPDQIKSILDQVLPHIPNRLSIKTRVGRHDPGEIETLLPLFNQYPLTEVIIHPRTGEEMYTGTADPDRFAAIMDLSDHPLVYNGDIWNVAVFRALAQRFPAIHRWMIGRGVMADPFLPWDIQSGEPQSSNRLDQFIRFHDALFYALTQTLDGPAHVLDKMKGYWSFFYLSFEDGRKLFKKIRKIQRLDDYIDTLHRFFGGNPVQCPVEG